MKTRRPLSAVAVLGALAFAASACTPADNDADAAPDTDTTTIIERDRREGDSTTVRAGRDGIEVETTNR